MMLLLFSFLCQFVLGGRTFLCEVHHTGLCSYGPCPRLGPHPCSASPSNLPPGLGQEGLGFQLAPGF